MQKTACLAITDTFDHIRILRNIVTEFSSCNFRQLMTSNVKIPKSAKALIWIDHPWQNCNAKYKQLCQWFQNDRHMPHDNIPTICVRFGDQIECRGPQRDFTKILRHWRPQLCTLCACQMLSAKQRETIPNPHYRMRIYHTHSRLTNRTCHSARDEQNSSTMPYATKCLVFKALWQLATEGELDSEESSTEPDSIPTAVYWL